MVTGQTKSGSQPLMDIKKIKIKIKARDVNRYGTCRRNRKATVQSGLGGRRRQGPRRPNARTRNLPRRKTQDTQRLCWFQAVVSSPLRTPRGCQRTCAQCPRLEQISNHHSAFLYSLCSVSFARLSTVLPGIRLSSQTRLKRRFNCTSAGSPEDKVII